MKVDLNDYDNIKYLALMSLNSNKGKYWASEDFGSSLFLLNKSKINKSTPAEVKRIIEESLNWLIEDELAESISVNTKLHSPNRIDWTIEIIKIIKTNDREKELEKELIKGAFGNEES